MDVAHEDPGEIERELQRRRAQVAFKWDLKDAVVIAAGEPVPVPGRGDRTYPFRSHSEYLYLTDRERPHGVLAFDPDAGWVDFVAPVTKDEMLWEGATSDEAEGRPIDQLDAWLEERRDREVARLGSVERGNSGPSELERELRRQLNEMRRRKDDVELARMAVAERATSAGFAAIEPLLKEGMTERAIEIELEAEFFRHGADFLAFESIVASGPHSAVLHFKPTDRQMSAGELVLIDAGGEFRGYASDVTRTYVVGGRPNDLQSSLFDVTRQANRVATSHCLAGTWFREVHTAAARVIAEGLIDLGILRGSSDAVLESGAVSLFFPHGIGHMVGLGIRDAIDDAPARDAEPGMPPLRSDVELAPRNVVTIEPGVYFVEALLADGLTRAKHAEAVDWARVDSLVGFGGIRIEDNVLVTDEEPVVLTHDIRR